MNGTINS